ncbi:MAG: putative lipid II flippase FtsW [Oscillospiraceae bacterium]|nr:putative lipid II flippase FtsW [Oscillospiraceae bacterium]
MRYDGARLAGLSSAGTVNRRPAFDGPFFTVSMLLLTVGVIMVLSASYPRAWYDPSHVTGGNAVYYFVRQLIFALLGIGVMLLASRLPMGFYRRYAFHFLALTLVLLMLVPLIGVKANGSRRWLGVGGLTLQPSELAKLAVILSFSVLICRFRDRMRSFRYGILPFAGILAGIVGLLILEPHFSASVIILAIGAVMLFVGGVRTGWFVGAFSAAAGGIAVLLTFFPYASTRINTWRDPFSDTSDQGYQIVQSLYTIGSGGLSGLGLGGSRQKFLYLPEEHNDFIFSVVCEELGFIGAALILCLFALLILRGFWIAFHCRDRFSFLVCCGITSLLAIQVFLNVAVVTNLVPCTGISLPMFSYGGTALLIQLGELGIVLSASRDIANH